MKKSWKNIILVLIALAASVSVLTACSNDTSSSDASSEISDAVSNVEESSEAEKQTEDPLNMVPILQRKYIKENEENFTDKDVFCYGRVPRTGKLVKLLGRDEEEGYLFVLVYDGRVKLVESEDVEVLPLDYQVKDTDVFYDR